MDKIESPKIGSRKRKAPAVQEHEAPTCRKKKCKNIKSSSTKRKASALQEPEPPAGRKKQRKKFLNKNASSGFGYETIKTCLSVFPIHSSVKYNVILADPPWSYPQGGRTHIGTTPYPTMSVSEIKALPVKQIAAADCALFLWTTASRLPEALSVINAWGFDYKTVFLVWVKVYKNKSLVCGLGNYSRGSCEFVLVACKGRPLQFRKSRNVYQVIRTFEEVEPPQPTITDHPPATSLPPSPTTTISSLVHPSEHHSNVEPTFPENIVTTEMRKLHSEKPEESFERIETFFGNTDNLPKIELFARQKRPGWSSWGLELTQTFEQLLQCTTPFKPEVFLHEHTTTTGHHHTHKDKNKEHK